MKKKEIHNRSAHSLMSFLSEVIENASDYKSDLKLKKALQSQGALAAYDNDTLGIVSCSLNTLKASVERMFGESGFDTLDRRRVNAKGVIEQSEKPESSSNKTTKAGLLNMVNELEIEVSILEKQNLMLTELIFGVFSQYEHCVLKSDDDELLADLKTRRQEFYAKINYIDNTGVNQ